MKPLKRSTILGLAVALVLSVTALDLHASLNGPGRVARKRLSSSVVQITVYDWRGVFVRQGWGFFINREGHIITSRSLLEGGFYVEATTVSRDTFLVNRVLAEDAEGNFIRLGLESPPERFAYLEKSAPLPGDGERILVGGGIGCEPGAFLDGRIGGVRQVPVYGSLVRIDSPCASTGSPVFNEKGILVAVVMFRLENGNGSAWAVPVGRIAKVMTAKVQPVQHLAWAEKRQGNWDRTTVGSYMTGLANYWTGQYGSAMPRLMAATKDERFRREAFFLLGCCYDAVGQPTSSVDAYTMAVRLGDSSHETFLNLAKAYLVQGDLPKALDAAWMAIRARLDSYEGFTLLGEVYNSMGKFPEAFAVSYVAIKIDPKRAEAYHQKGVALREQNKFSEAIEALKSSLSIDPECSRAYWDLALAYYSSGDRESAAGICQALKKVDPGLAEQLLTRVTH